MDSSRRVCAASHGHRERSRGQAAVEFALILPVFMLLLLLAVDFGRLFFTYIQLNNTAREGAAYAAFNPTTSNGTLTTIALREANVQAQRGEGAVTATAECVDSSGTALACSSALGGSGAGNRVTVTVGETFTFLTPLIGNVWPGGLRVGASATAAVVAWAAGGGTPPATCTTLPPTPSFTWQSPDPVNRPNLISVDAGASTSPASPCHVVGYNWDFGGTSTDPSGDALREGIVQDYEYAGGGTYTVTLTVQNAAGETSTTRTITVGSTTCNPPTASVTVSPALVIDKNGKTNWNAANPGGQGATQFTFSGSLSAFMTDPACHPVWSWDLGDGTTSAAISVVHGYAHSWSGKTVQVTLKVTNDAGSNTSLPFDIPLQ